MYDPNWPQNGQLIDGDRFRVQFAGIVDLIQSGGGISAALVDSTSTLPPGSSAGASVTVDGNLLRFTFEIPQGDPGNPGEPGPPGEITSAQLSDAILTTSSNSNSVGTLDAPFADPDDEALRNKVNELILALRRNP